MPGVAIDTIGAYGTKATTAATLAALTASPGDSFSIRNFPTSNWARLEAIFREGAAKGQVRVESPMMHDDVKGITLGPGNAVSQYLLPQQVGQQVYPGDTLTVESDIAAAGSTLVGLLIYYQSLSSSEARLHSWGDISGIIKNIKPMEVDVTTSGTIGTWEDTAINSVDKQLHAGHDYAVLGYQVDTAIACVGVKGQETANLRNCGPGIIDSGFTSDYYVMMSNRHGTPHIPVFNADNASAYYVSTLANAASVASKVYMILAELAHTIG